MQNRPVVALLLAFSATSCASFTSPARVHKLETGSSYWFDYEGTRRGMILVSATDNAGRPAIRSCAEPSPDVAIAFSGGGEASGSQIGSVKVSAEGNGRQTINELGERTQMVMFFREALFRVCEISLNQNLDSAQISSLYKEIIQTALRLGSDKYLDIELAARQRELEQTLVEKLGIEREIKDKELQVAQLKENTARREQAEQELATLELKSKQLGTRLVDQIDALNRHSQQTAENIARATADAAGQSMLAPSSSDAAHSP